MSTEVIIGIVIWYLIGLFSNLFMMYRSYNRGHDITLFDITMGILTSALGFIAFLIMLETNPITVIKGKRSSLLDFDD